MAKSIHEDEIELAALEMLQEDMGYKWIYGPDIAPDIISGERSTWATVVLKQRLEEAIGRINPNIPVDAREEAIKKVVRTDSPDLIVNNHLFHKMLVDGVNVEYRRPDGSIAGDKVWLIDYNNPDNNEFLAINQFTIIENNRNRRPDIIIFINGLPLVVIELKNPGDENATIEGAYNQFRTYEKDIPGLFRYNALLMISDGLEAKVGSITSPNERFMPWKTIDGKSPAPTILPQMEVMLKGMFQKDVLIDLIRNFIVYEEDYNGLAKKVAAYHQYYAVNKAVESTIKASSPEGDKRCGVIWHTQGSGKSLSMVFYAGKLVVSKKMDNPTIVLLTDRNDLDDQLFGTFGRCNELLRQSPVQADSREDIKEKLKVASGGIIFTTIQKFLPQEKGGEYPMLSERRNIIVIADEAHRSQYDFIDGFARHMRDALPNASYIGFTGTPIEKADKSTPAVFGEYIDVYDIEQAVADKATVPIYYEGKLIRLGISENLLPKVDEEFEDVTEGEEISRKQKLKSKWARLEAVVGSKERLHEVAETIVEHFEARLEGLNGKGMIVAMSRRICVDLYKEIIDLKPEWHHEDDDKGIIKVIMSGSASDPEDWQNHVRNKQRRRAIGDRLKDPEDELKLVIVRDMWLTGFDAPCLHTMYTDKPMRSHGLMQAIARVNRVFNNKPGGLVVDLLGLGNDLKKALSEYTDGDRRNAGIPQEEAVAVMKTKYEIVSDMLHGFDYSRYFGSSGMEKLELMKASMELILSQEDGKKRFIQHVMELSKAFALSVPHYEALIIKDDVGFFQAVKSGLVKLTPSSGKTDQQLDSAIRQIISKSVTTGDVIDIFSLVGSGRKDISILSDEFLAEVKGMTHKNLALEALRKLLNDEIKAREKKNVIQARNFSEMLQEAIRKYQNRSIETAQVIEELIRLAKDIRAAEKRGEELNMTDDELAFYDALEVNDSAVKILGDEILRTIARDLVDTIKNNVSVDWTVRENVQAKLRVAVKRILKKYGYPPDKRKIATELVLKQAEMIAKDWAEVVA